MQVYTDHVCTGIFESVKEWRYKGSYLKARGLECGIEFEDA